MISLLKVLFVFVFVFFTHAATSFPNGHFSMRALRHLEKVLPVSIFNQLAPNYLNLAKTLQFDESMYNSLGDMKDTPAEGCQAVFEEWLSQAAVPPTWKNLMDSLQKLEMGEVAKCIKAFFSKQPILVRIGMYFLIQ